MKKSKRKTHKPRDFKMPASRVVAASAREGTDRYFQISSSGSLQAATARRLANWLLRTADWMERK